MRLSKGQQSSLIHFTGATSELAEGSMSETSSSALGTSWTWQWCSVCTVCTRIVRRKTTNIFWLWSRTGYWFPVTSVDSWRVECGHLLLVFWIAIVDQYRVNRPGKRVEYFDRIRTGSMGLCTHSAELVSISAPSVVGGNLFHLIWQRTEV